MMNMQKMMKQAQKMQAQMEKSQEELHAKTFTGKDPAGMVQVTMNGAKKVDAINLSADVVDPDDIDMLQDLLISAINDAMTQVDQEQEKTMGSLTKGLPGF